MARIPTRVRRVFRDPLWARRMGVTAAATCCLAVVGLRTFNGRVSESELMAISIGIAIVFGLVSAMQNEFGERRRMTVELLGAFSTADSLAGSDTAVARFLAKDSAIGADVDAEFDRHLIQVMDYYEFLCRSAHSGAIDRRMLRALRGGAIAVLYGRSQGYISARRQMYGQGLYSMIEWFVDEYCDAVGGSTTGPSLASPDDCPAADTTVMTPAAVTARETPEAEPMHEVTEPAQTQEAV